VTGRKTRCAPAGLGGRHEMCRDAVTKRFAAASGMAALCDLNEGRLQLARQRAAAYERVVMAWRTSPQVLVAR